MKQKHPFRKSNTTLLVAFLSLFCLTLLHAQQFPIVLNWDKTGCQQNNVDNINFDANFQTAACLKVCKNSITTYRLTGDGMQNVTSIDWEVTGGVVESKDEFAAIEWDESINGTISIALTFMDSTSVNRSICVQKASAYLVLGWDKIGCQIEENNVCEMKLTNNNATMPCLKVCKDSKPSYTLSGDGVANISTITWSVTGGVADDPNYIKTPISWDNSAGGTLSIAIVFNNGTTLQKNICVNKINSTLLLDWEKIDESSIREIKLDNSEDNKEVLLVYPESTVLYKIDGKSLDNVASVEWEIIGGYAYNNTGFTTPVTWFDDENKKLILHITYLDGTVVDQSIAILNKKSIENGDVFDYADRVLFTYDEAGNQKIRKLCINCCKARNSNQKNDEKKRPTNEEVIKDNYLTFYPNPVKEELHIDFGKSYNVGNQIFVSQVDVFNILGQIQKSFNNLENKNNLIINFLNFSQGTYIVLVTYSDNKSTNIKIIKN